MCAGAFVAPLGLSEELKSAFLISRHYQASGVEPTGSKTIAGAFRRRCFVFFVRLCRATLTATRFPVIRRHGSQIFASKKLNWKYLRQISSGVICWRETEDGGEERGHGRRERHDVFGRIRATSAVKCAKKEKEGRGGGEVGRWG
ncbi:hypothetical protein Zmor_019930 [Zophobas morio]|uniref:Uncharacterized protein n=1 Tax=Zophobas morio TaxID=2755281 RepID=A0AA38M8X3_9CUCU|nr:hypothetical protein Zmor_019930 [Zophobas morio]